jgi:hypothetical protein
MLAGRMTARAVVAGAVMAAALAWAASARAEEQAVETDNELLRQGLQLYEELEYERAVEVLSAALLERDNTTQERLLIYRTLGTLYVYLDRPQEAALALRQLLCVDASFDFGEYASPRIREVFDRVRREWTTEGRPCETQLGPAEPAPQSVSLDHESPHSASPGEEVELQVTVDDPGHRVASVALRYRAQGEEGFNEARATMASPGAYEATIPRDAVRPPAAEYYLQALDAAGAPLATLGTSRAPLRVAVSAPGGGGTEHRSIASRWWFWTIIGVVVVGAGLGLGLGLGLQEPEPNPPPDDATLTIRICDGETDTCLTP